MSRVQLDGDSAVLYVVYVRQSGKRCIQLFERQLQIVFGLLSSAIPA